MMILNGSDLLNLNLFLFSPPLAQKISTMPLQGTPPRCDQRVV